LPVIPPSQKIYLNLHVNSKSRAEKLKKTNRRNLFIRANVIYMYMDLQQFEIKILPLKDKIFRLAKALLTDASEAEDAVQDIYLKLWSLRNELDKADNLTAFSLQIARNHCFDRLRSLSRVQFSELTDNEEKISSERSPYEQTEQTDLINAIKRLIGALPEQQRIVIHLRDVEGLEMDEIVTITGMTENAIKVYLSRARQSIRKSFEKK
jgi:RNA polymerase sigma factor (sigma-70 family)